MVIYTIIHLHNRMPAVLKARQPFLRSFKMSKLFALALVALNFAFAANATSLHPCTPVVEATPSRLNCQRDGYFYTITINTLMSGPNCREGRIEISRATIAVSNEEQEITRLEAQPGTFSYQLGGAREGRFDSDALNLHLRDCVSPMHGGFSVGN